MKTGWRKRTAQQNEILGAELGRTWTGANRYRWVWSEDPEFFRSKLVVHKDLGGKFDPVYKITEPGEGRALAAVEPQYVREKLLPKIANCFVMCRWLDNGGFEEFKAKFGDKLEWPGEGSYFPVEHSQGVVQLYPNQEPTREDTWEFIRILRKDTQLGMEGIMAQLEAGEKAAEKAALLKNLGRLDNVLPAFDHIPGKRGSGGIWARGGEPEFTRMVKDFESGGGAFFTNGQPGDSIMSEILPKPPRSSQIIDPGQ